MFRMLRLSIYNYCKVRVRFRSAKFLQFFAWSGWAAGLYYWLFSRRFDREHLAVLNGRLGYHRNLTDSVMNNPLLRRNIHRLEKGLIMRPRREVFGEDFIVETVRSYEKSKQVSGYDAEELKWAEDVLSEYFRVVTDTPEISTARRIYGECRLKKTDYSGKEEGYKPYPASELPPSGLSFQELEQLFHRRRSVRWYTTSPVPYELIQKAINAGSLAPSACNRQPYRFIISNEPIEAQEIAACARGTPGWGHQIPAILVLVGDLSAYPQERDRHLIYIDGSLAAMQVMLAADTLGLSTCAINWPDVDKSEDKLRRTVRLAAYERVIMLLSIGYRDDSGEIPYSQKKTGRRIAGEHIGR